MEIVKLLDELNNTNDRLQYTLLLENILNIISSDNNDVAKKKNTPLNYQKNETYFSDEFYTKIIGHEGQNEINFDTLYEKIETINYNRIEKLFEIKSSSDYLIKNATKEFNNDNVTKLFDNYDTIFKKDHKILTYDYINGKFEENNDKDMHFKFIESLILTEINDPLINNYFNNLTDRLKGTIDLLYKFTHEKYNKNILRYDSIISEKNIIKEKNKSNLSNDEYIEIIQNYVVQYINEHKKFKTKPVISFINFPKLKIENDNNGSLKHIMKSIVDNYENIDMKDIIRLLQNLSNY